MTSVDLATQLVIVARKFIGVHEEGGDNKGEWVERFQKAVDGKSFGEPWCAAFCAYCLNEVEQLFHVKHSLILSEHVATMWNLNPMQRREDALPGRLACWKFKGTQNGHMGIVTAVEGFKFKTVEGNTSGGSGIVREGDGVFEKIRSMQGTDTFRLLGFLEPFGRK